MKKGTTHAENSTQEKKEEKRPVESIDDDYRMVECMKNAMYTLKNQMKKKSL